MDLEGWLGHPSRGGYHRHGRVVSETPLDRVRPPRQVWPEGVLSGLQDVQQGEYASTVDRAVPTVL